MERESPEAALFAVWVDRLRERVFVPHVPPDLWQRARGSISLPTLLGVLKDPESSLCGYACRGDALGNALDDAVTFLEQRLDRNWDNWRWGRLHTAAFTHPLSAGERATWLSRGPVERSGDAHTVNAASGAGFRQTSGASFRQVIDLADWDRSLVSNVPGQSGQPESPHYDDLLQLWKDDRYFPLLYTRAAIEKQTKQTLVLHPR
jgi:penicillin amidase